ncbi:MAG: hypothetical protein P8H65_09825 [Rhodothermales bacterium]|jgi:hypothetical protein|nr:hypothetical protein [Bacteroidetes Order II. bacterium]MDG1755261.1 hypothetical protein [Rhodothermales bacterium]MDG2016078.1 hypothetical protein [Rhodothermales bacterium]HAY35825.1 hypothetical protein [Bacteroidota bacterium]
MLKLFILIVLGPWLISRVFQHWYDWQSESGPEFEQETELERKLNDTEAQTRFLYAWQVTTEENRQSQKVQKWQTPEKVLPEERLKRKNRPWEPQIPGVVFNRD